MKTCVKKDTWIGCGNYTYIAENVFEIGEDGLAQVKGNEEKIEVVEEEKESVQDAAESCPTGAIVIEEE